MDEAAADAALFDGAVACELTARLRVQPGPPPAGSAEGVERLLRDLAMMEERRGESDDPAHPPDPALRRLEAKLDLTLQLLAQALPALAPPPPRAVRLSARGLRIDASAADAEVVDAPATLAWQPGDGLPLLAYLPVRRLARQGDTSWWAFEPLEPALADLLERHVFRLHRRWLAAQRRG
ncbi:PilZ domain-containing protein [Silanimonas sp.]|uniref:PilZ domain-containing protein n=1 Tax=Silanimonas sp. TaxID=1929290 RepID=UPI0037CA4E41